jgi:hypothetical protein
MKNRAFFAVGAIVAAALVSLALGADTDSGGGTRYTPTQGEWLCMLLNMDEAAADEMQFPTGAGIRYRYDHERPDTIEIELLYSANIGAPERRNRAKYAEQTAKEVAKLKGWDGWLKLKLTEKKITDRPGAKPLDQ